jgi:hypothetical protein
MKRESLTRSLHEAAGYLMKTERHFELPEGLGWEYHLKSKGVSFQIVKMAFWSLLVFFNLLVAILATLLR